jgi:hypothetical protein
MVVSPLSPDIPPSADETVTVPDELPVPLPDLRLTDPPVPWLDTPPLKVIAPPAWLEEDEVLAPAATSTLPPSLSELTPAEAAREPPFPLLPDPTSIFMLPPLPPVATPDLMSTFPEEGLEELAVRAPLEREMNPVFPSVVVPVENWSEPESPSEPALADFTLTDPDEVAVPNPEVKTTEPPVFSDEAPEVKVKSPPLVIPAPDATLI